MATKVTLNGIDFSELVGDAVYFGDKCYIPIDFLQSFFKADINANKANDTVNINIKLEEMLASVFKAKSAPTALQLNMTKDEAGNLKAKAGISMGDMFNASVDQNGKVDASLSFKL